VRLPEAVTRPAVRAGRVGAALALQHARRPDPARVFFNSFNGRFSDNPRGIHDELARRGGFHHTWVSRAAREPMPPGAARVTPYGWRYLEDLGRAGLLVSNLQMSRNFVKRRGTTYLQTWHGTPLKRIGRDNDRWKANEAGWETFAADVAKWDYLVTQNPFSTEIFRRAFAFEGEILEEGYPRNDVLSAPDAPQRREAIRAELGIPAGAKVILYAPTWRDTLVDDSGALRFSLALDADALLRTLGDGHVLLLRLHYLIASRLADSLGAGVRNVSDHPDIRDLYLAADVLITDYSSAMFDFAVTGKPIVLFTYDLDEYRDQTRGFYFDLEAEAPGPVCATSDEVISVLGDLDAVKRSHAERYARFRARFCPLDDGNAARRILDRVLAA